MLLSAKWDLQPDNKLTPDYLKKIFFWKSCGIWKKVYISNLGQVSILKVNFPKSVSFNLFSISVFFFKRDHHRKPNLNISIAYSFHNSIASKLKLLSFNALLCYRSTSKDEMCRILLYFEKCNLNEFDILPYYCLLFAGCPL